jgi:hypothetical protein
MFCQGCGNQILAQAVICPKCGCATDKFKKDGTISNGVLWGTYLFSVFMPLIGFILGIYVLVKGKVVHGVAAMALSLFMWLFWVGFLSALK